MAALAPASLCCPFAAHPLGRAHPRDGLRLTHHRRRAHPRRRVARRPPRRAPRCLQHRPRGQAPPPPPHGPAPEHPGEQARAPRPRPRPRHGLPRHPDLFRLVHTARGGHALQLADDSPPTPPFPSLSPTTPPPDGLIDRPRRFPHLRLRRGLNLRRAHRDYLLRFHSLPEVPPFEPLDEGAGLEMLERRACAVVREVLAMTVEKRTLVDHLTHFRRDFGLPNRLRALLVRHSELFYVSVKGVRHSVFLVEAFDDDGRLLVADEMLVGRDRLEELVWEGKRMRRERKKGVLVFDGDSDDDEDDEAVEEEDALQLDDDEFGDLIENGVMGDDWVEAGDGDGSEAYDDENDAESDAMEEFWVKKAVAQGLIDDGSKLDVW